MENRIFQRRTEIVILRRSIGGVCDPRLCVVEWTRELRGFQRFAVRALVLKNVNQGLEPFINVPGGTLANLRLVGKFLLWIRKISRQCWSASVALLDRGSPPPSRFLQRIPELQILTFSHFFCARTSEGEYYASYIFTVLLARIRRVVSRQILNFGHWRVDLDLVVSTVVCAAEEHSPTKLAHFPALKHVNSSPLLFYIFKWVKNGNK